MVEISESAFAYCTFLNDIVIPSTVTTIRENAFYQCTKVIYIFIPNINIVTIEQYAFRGISGAQIHLQANALPTSFTTDRNRIGNKSGSSTDSSAYIQYILGIDSIATESDFIFIVQNNYSYITQYIGNSVNVSVPLTLGGYNVRSIKEEAFYYNNYITSIDMTLATSLISIEKKAFQNCDALTTIMFPNSLEEIGDDAFYDSNNITSLTIPKSVKTIGSNAFINTYNVKSLSFEGANDNTSSLTSIGSGAFQNCGRYFTPATTVELIIPSSLTDTSTTTYNQRIGNNSFNSCNLFTTLTFKDNPNATLAANSRISINENAFINCANLSVINWGNWVNELGSNCFSNCTKLPYLYIPLSINIVRNSISKNSKLTIYYEGTKASYTLTGTPESQSDTYNSAPFPSEKNGVYYNVGDVSNIKLEITQKYYYIYDDSTVKEDAKEPGGNHITISGYVKTNAYLGLTANSATMKIAESHLINGTSYQVTEIGQAAFAGDGYTKRFDLPNTVLMIGLSGFYGCNNTTQIIGYTGPTYNNEYVFLPV